MDRDYIGTGAAQSVRDQPPRELERIEAFANQLEHECDMLQRCYERYTGSGDPSMPEQPTAIGHSAQLDRMGRAIARLNDLSTKLTTIL